MTQTNQSSIPPTQTAPSTAMTAEPETKPSYAISEESKAYELVIRKAKALSNSSLVPDTYRGPNGIANCILAQNMADRIGADVLMVIQNLDIVHGRPGFRSTFLIATVNSSRRFSPLRFEWFNAPKPGEKPSDNWGCRAYATSRDDGKECVGMTITWGIAKSEGWVSRKGSKWLTITEQMFMYRAASFWVRIFCPELTLGMRTTDEIEDMDEPSRLPPSITVSAEDGNGERRPPLTSGDLYGDEPQGATASTSSDDPEADRGVGD